MDSSNPSKNSRFRLRNAEARDAAPVLEIYSPMITDEVTSFEFEVPSEEEMKRRIETTLVDFPWLICETEDGIVAGYAYACRHRERLGYQWITETGIYVSSHFRGQGVGSILYNKLCEILTKQGYYQAVAYIAGYANTGSTEFHKKLGFLHNATWKNKGNKFGKWVDVNSYVKILQELKENPTTPVPYSNIQEEINLN